MATIYKTVDVPPDHMVRLEIAIPKEVPEGKVEMAITVSPAKKRISRTKLLALAGAWSNSKTFERDGAAMQREMHDEWD